MGYADDSWFPLESRKFFFTYRVEIPASPSEINLWIPCPSSDELQAVSISKIESPAPYSVEEDAREGNRMFHLRLPPADDGRFFESRYLIERRMRRSPAPSDAFYADSPAGPLARFLQGNTRVPIDVDFLNTARSIASASEPPRAIARKIFDYLIAILEYDDAGCTPERHAELGDLQMACYIRRGTCTEFHGLFVAYARALGLPARFAFGFNIPGRTHGVIAGYHCWAEVYMPGIQWFPIDVSEAYKLDSPEKRDFYFGNLDANRVQFSTGRDVDLVPLQRGGPVDKFIFPVAQTRDGDFTVYPSFSFSERLARSDYTIANLPTHVPP